jgi:hypothetical protein
MPRPRRRRGPDRRALPDGAARPPPTSRPAGCPGGALRSSDTHRWAPGRPGGAPPPDAARRPAVRLPGPTPRSSGAHRWVPTSPGGPGGPYPARAAVDGGARGRRVVVCPLPPPRARRPSRSGCRLPLTSRLRAPDGPRVPRVSGPSLSVIERKSAQPRGPGPVRRHIPLGAGAGRACFTAERLRPEATLPSGRNGSARPLMNKTLHRSALGDAYGGGPVAPSRPARPSRSTGRAASAPPLP